MAVPDDVAETLDANIVTGRVAADALRIVE